MCAPWMLVFQAAVTRFVTSGATVLVERNASRIRSPAIAASGWPYSLLDESTAVGMPEL